jgi:hypothetical protein
MWQHDFPAGAATLAALMMEVPRGAAPPVAAPSLTEFALPARLASPHGDSAEQLHVRPCMLGGRRGVVRGGWPFQWR